MEGAARCRLHGGATPRGEALPQYKHGRYSKYVMPSIAEKLTTVNDENPLDLLPELHMQRALFAEYVGRFKPGVPLGIGDIDYMMGWSAEIGKSVERIVKLRNDTALTQAEVRFIAMRVIELLGKYVADPNERQSFISELLEGLPALAGRTE
jgi:hypothetical protein